MGRLSSMLWGAAVGAGLMYFWDPENGSRRKEMVRDKVFQLQNQGDEAIEAAISDLRMRTRSVIAKGVAMVSGEENIPQRQGEDWMPGDSRGSLQWSPSARLLAGVGSAYLMLYATVRGGLIGFLARLGGFALGARALTSLNMRRTDQMSPEGDATRARKSPLEESETNPKGRRVSRKEVMPVTGKGRKTPNTITGKSPEEIEGALDRRREDEEMEEIDREMPDPRDL